MWSGDDVNMDDEMSGNSNDSGEAAMEDDDQSCSSSSVTKLSTQFQLELNASSPSHNNPQSNPKVDNLVQLFKELSESEQCETFTRLLYETSMSNIRHLRHLIEPFFQRDFLSCLPIELGVQIVSHLEGTERIKLSHVSQNWKLVSEVDSNWRSICSKTVLSLPDPSNRIYGAWAATAVGQGVNIPDHCVMDNFSVTRMDKMLSKHGSVFARAPDKARFMRMLKIEKNWREKPIRGSCVLKGHEDHVITCMQIHDDLLVTGSDDNTLKVWSIDKGDVLFNLVGHTGGVWTSQISSCGRFIISGSTDRTVKVWSSSDGSLVHTLQGHTSTVRCMAMCKNILVTGSRDTTLRTWDVERGTCLSVLVGHQAAVRCVQFDGCLVVSGGYDFTVKIWSAKSGNCLKTLNGHTNRVYSLLFDRERAIVASGSLDTSIRVWDFRREDGKECISLLQGHTSLTSGMQLRGDILVSCNADSTVRVWNIYDGSCLFHLHGHRSAITSLQFFGDQIVATSSDDGTVKLWDIKKGQFIRDLVTLESGGNGGCIWRLCATPTLLACAVGSRNNTEETKIILLDFDSVYP
ncbi:unnamed protein product [Caenorhabditis angaria]|uniref:F-box domain-containing protein n=1 Tax=Caenorhabditis angaria TaxID=860376 RepID=A0A9P1N7F0_9PELO|nr:unnamed protein product [Caenorhabditis angaria]